MIVSYRVYAIHRAYTPKSSQPANQPMMTANDPNCRLFFASVKLKIGGVWDEGSFPTGTNGGGGTGG